MSNVHSSVTKLSNKYFEEIGKPCREILSFCFCDNEKDANECGQLVLQREKRATASSLWAYQKDEIQLPKRADNQVITNWEGIALCVIEVEKVEIIPFNEISSEFAEAEGEGDKSLKYWKKVHWDYFRRELANSELEPRQDMLIVCEYFYVVCE